MAPRVVGWMAMVPVGGPEREQPMVDSHDDVLVFNTREEAAAWGRPLRLVVLVRAWEAS